jgi:purine-binding chemotaxis protein CheW
MNSRLLCTFTVADGWYGVAVDDVQEVIRHQEVTPAPLADPVVVGLINLRGQIVTALDLRRRMGLPDRPANATPMNVVVRTSDGPKALLVDDIGDVIEVSDHQQEPPPGTVSQTVRDIALGVYKLDRTLLLTLDTEKTASVS